VVLPGWLSVVLPGVAWVGAVWLVLFGLWVADGAESTG